MIDISDNENPWHVWLQLASPDEDKPLKPFDKQGDILLFIKMFDPYTQTIAYCGHLQIPLDGPSVST